jgi:hypothetical protein
MYEEVEVELYTFLKTPDGNVSVCGGLTPWQLYHSEIVLKASQWHIQCGGKGKNICYCQEANATHSHATTLSELC